MAEVFLRNVSKSFGKQSALVDVSLRVPDGSFVVLLGPTGAGKTTTLRMISGHFQDFLLDNIFRCFENGRAQRKGQVFSHWHVGIE